MNQKPCTLSIDKQRKNTLLSLFIYCSVSIKIKTGGASSGFQTLFLIILIYSTDTNYRKEYIMKKSVPILLAVILTMAFTGCTDPTSSSFPDTSTDTSSYANSVISSENAFTESDITVSESKVSNEVSTKPISSKSISSRTVSAKVPVSSTAPRKEISILIPPGFTVRKIAARMEAKGVCKATDFIKTANTGDFSDYSVTAGITNPQKRCYRLEGYLYPDTYTFYENSAPEDVIKKILQNTQKKLVGKYSHPDMTLDEIVTLASLIEKEGGGNPAESGKISSVLHNRLKKGQPLQLDAPIYYLENDMGDADTQKYKIWYNTYNYQNREVKYDCPGLPAGAICSPSAASLKAAANPEHTDYLYFGSDSSKNYFYAATFDEFKAKGAELGVNIR